MKPCPIQAQDPAQKRQRYLSLRDRSLEIVAPLSAEDMGAQSMPDCSPTKWHLGHTTWFFETFFLMSRPGYQAFDPVFAYVFNSYYEALGPRQPRPQRGLLTRPSLERVLEYRHYVDRHMLALLDQEDLNFDMFELGVAHEEQHQELILMDILHLLAQSPLNAVYDSDWGADSSNRQAQFQLRPGGLVEIGHCGDGFAFDNESPRHKVWLQPFEIADRLVTNADWQAFIADSGYQRSDLWLSDGWAKVQAKGWNAPLYWRQVETGWLEMTLGGLRPLDPEAPVSHISFYEADAYARWAGARLPSEAEWEAAAADGVLEDTYGAVWQWTASAYLAYPGFKPGLGAVGEYNGKFMSGQMTLRGGSAFTPQGHSRPTYRNFFQPEKRWVRAGLRLARNVEVESHDPKFWDETCAEDVVTGLSARQKSMSPKYFYDATGSELFEAICRTPEYYPTRVETALLTEIATELTQALPDQTILVEFGSGASEKTKTLLNAAPCITTYVPIDISPDALRLATVRLSAAYAHLSVSPVVGDFTGPIELPDSLRDRPLIGFFPGSTIGNFTPSEARQLLKTMRKVLGPNAKLILGADIIKSETTIVAAYDDAGGITAEFNKNLLRRINRELDGNFDLTSFDHLAIWNAELARMEMHLVSRMDQIVTAAGHSFAFKAGERLHTENSHKFTPGMIAELAHDSGWAVTQFWLSPEPQFGVFLLG